MGTRLQLHSELKKITTNVYFQPPEDFKLNYPCILYSRSRIDTMYANDKPYTHRVAYTVMVIDRDPDSGIPAMVGSLPTSRFDRHYTSNNLNHDVYSLYY